MKRWPAVLPHVTRSALALPQGSRLRQATLRQFARTAFEVWNSGNFKLVPYIDQPDVETHFNLASGVPIGFDNVFYGPAGHCRSMEIWNEAWEKWDATIDEVIEEGRDSVIVVALIIAEGSASGVRLEEWVAVRYTFRAGKVSRVDAGLGAERESALQFLPRA